MHVCQLYDVFEKKVHVQQNLEREAVACEGGGGDMEAAAPLVVGRGMFNALK